MPAPLHRLLNPAPPPPPTNAEPDPGPELGPGDAMTANAASLISYKRAPKACTQCRRDKTRCQATRPCKSCVKKGLEHDCLDGCLACRKNKLKCDGDRPCAPCYEAGHECLEHDHAAIPSPRAKKKARRSSGSPTLRPTTTSTPKSATLKLSAPPTFSPPAAPTVKLTFPPAPKHTVATTAPTPTHANTHAPHHRAKAPASNGHTKLACLACRRDNKRCAGGKTCPRCVENGEPCVYVARAPKLVKKRCARCRAKNKKCEDVRPCLHCAKAGVECIDMPRRGAGRGVRVKKACEGCRKDKVRCEETRPCGRCQRQHIACVERECKACVAKGAECDSCRRAKLFHTDSPTESDSGSGSEEEEGPLTPPVPSPLHSLLSLRPAAPAPAFPRLPTPPKMDYTHRSIMDAPAPTAPSAHPMRPGWLPPSPTIPYVPEVPFLLATGSYASLSLATSMSDMRTYAYD